MLVSPCLISARNVIGPVPAGGARKTMRSRKCFGSAYRCITAFRSQPMSSGAQKRAGSSSGIAHSPTLVSLESPVFTA